MGGCRLVSGWVGWGFTCPLTPSTAAGGEQEQGISQTKACCIVTERHLWVLSNWHPEVQAYCATACLTTQYWFGRFYPLLGHEIPVVAAEAPGAPPPSPPPRVPARAWLGALCPHLRAGHHSHVLHSGYQHNTDLGYRLVDIE